MKWIDIYLLIACFALVLLHHSSMLEEDADLDVEIAPVGLPFVRVIKPLINDM